MGIYHSEPRIITRGSDTFNGISSTRKQGSRGILLGDDQRRHMCRVASADSEWRSSEADIHRMFNKQRLVLLSDMRFTLGRKQVTLIT